MKKLLIAVSAAACALGAFADGEAFTQSGTSFESLTAGKFDPDNDDNGDAAATTGNRFWYTAAETGGIEATVMAFDADGASTAHEKTRPSQFASFANNNYLNIESTSKTLYRTVNVNSGSIGAGETGIYLDTMVQFTAGDPTMSADDDEAKLAIWVCGNDEDGNPLATTNFMVRAGQFKDGAFNKTNYTMKAVNADGSDTNLVFNAGDWYRLTVKTIENVGEVGGFSYAGYVVFVDGKMLVPASDDPSTGVSYDGNYAAGVVPSMVNSDTTIAAVGFFGTGAVDDISFTTSAPNFVVEEVKLTWTDGVTKLEYGDWSTNVTERGSATVPFVADKTVTVTYAAGYMAGTATGNLVDSGTYNVVAVPVAAVVGNAQYATLQAAIDAANGNTVVLQGDATVEYIEEQWAGQLVITNAVTLDLAGHEILPKVAEGLVITVGETGSLTITNSTETVGYVRGTIENGGANANALTLVGGKYLTSGLPTTDNYVVPAPFEAKELTDADAGYTQIVVATEEPEPTVITIVDANVTLSSESERYTGSSVAPTVTVVVNETTLVEGTDYDVTILPAEIVNAGSYTITVTGRGSYDGTVSKTFTVNAKSITPTLTLSADTGVLGSVGLAFPTVTVADGEVTLGAANYDAVWNPNEITKAGDYVVTVTLKDNYSGSATATFKVTAPVVPGETGQTVTATDEDAAKDAVTITAPTGIDATGYQGLFDKVATPNGDGTFTVTAQLTTAAEAEIKTEADAVVKTVDLTAAAAVTADGTLTPIAAEALTPGIYYSVEVADNLGFTGGKEGNRVMAGADGTANIPMPNPKVLENANGNARFFRVKANVKDK